jgi:hypothetical protein
MSDERKCGEPAASFIPRWGWSFACVLPKGHEGEHRQGGNCIKHGEYIGAQCPQWPECVKPEPPSDKVQAIERMAETADREGRYEDVILPDAEPQQVTVLEETKAVHRARERVAETKRIAVGSDVHLLEMLLERLGAAEQDRDNAYERVDDLEAERDRLKEQLEEAATQDADLQHEYRTLNSLYNGLLAKVAELEGALAIPGTIRAIFSDAGLAAHDAQVRREAQMEIESWQDAQKEGEK